MGIPTNYPGLTLEMVNMIKHKAFVLSNQFGFSQEDREDLEQDMALHLLGALRNYDPTKGALSTFADRVIVHWTAVLIRHRSAVRRSYKAVAFSLDDLRFAEDGEYETLADTLSAEDLPSENTTLGCIESIELKMDVDQIITGLPPKLRDVCVGLMMQTIPEYCAASGTARSTVDSRIRKLREIFTRAGYGNGDKKVS